MVVTVTRGAGTARCWRTRCTPLAVPTRAGGRHWPGCDGLIERRDRALDEGLATLCAAVRGASDPERAIAAALRALETAVPRTAPAWGAQLRLAAAGPGVRRVLDRTGASRALPLYPRVQAAWDGPAGAEPCGPVGGP